MSNLGDLEKKLQARLESGRSKTEKIYEDELTKLGDNFKEELANVRAGLSIVTAKLQLQQNTLKEESEKVEALTGQLQETISELESQRSLLESEVENSQKQSKILLSETGKVRELHTVLQTEIDRRLRFPPKIIMVLSMILLGMNTALSLYTIRGVMKMEGLVNSLSNQNQKNIQMKK